MKKKFFLALLLSLLMCFSLGACGSENSDDTSATNTPQEAPEVTEPDKKVKHIQPGDVITSEDWKVKLTDIYTSTTLESNESRTYWTANDGYAFTILEFDIECLNSTQPTIDGSGVTDLIAKVNGNTYGSWTYQYISSEMWLYADNTYLDANLPLHIYVYTNIPADSINKKVDVSLTIAGQECYATINE